MVHIITGPVDSGKTTLLYRVSRLVGTGDGFLLRKQFDGGALIGQSIRRIADGREMDFSRRLPYVPEGWVEACRYEDFSFSGSGMQFAGEIIDEALETGCEPIFIDEIGPLELGMKGFYALFRRVLASKVELFFTVRESCVDEVMRLFGITGHTVLGIKGKAFTQRGQ